MDEAWLALALTPGIGVARFTALLQRFDTPDGALSAPFELLRTVPGISEDSRTPSGRRIAGPVAER